MTKIYHCFELKLIYTIVFKLAEILFIFERIDNKHKFTARQTLNIAPEIINSC